MNFITNASYKTYRGIGLTFMAALLIVGVFSFGSVVKAEDNHGNNNINICHSLGNGSYTTVSVSKSGNLNGHNGGGIHSTDIIPSFDYNDHGPHHYPGKNWDTTGQAIWNNNCVVPPTKGTLTVIKHVINDNGGSAMASDFMMKLTGQNDFAGSENGTIFNTLTPGHYVVGETQLPGYTASYSGDCNVDGVTLAAGDSKTCTITNNDDVPPPPDRDQDGVPDSSDNCVSTANPNQEDADGDGVGDACDNCPQISNADQADSNQDSVGDACTPVGDDDDDTGGSITIDKVVSEGADGSHQFTFNYGDSSFLLSGNDAPHVLSGLSSGTYIISEADAGSDWFLSNISCSSGVEYATNKENGSVTVYLSGGKDVLCTFTNTYQPQTSFCEGNLIKNGSFEAPIVTDNGGDWQLFANLTSGLEWIAKLVGTETDAPLEIQAGYSGWVAQNGDQYAELDSTAPTTISQDVVTTPGQAYKLTYWRATRPGTLPENNAVWVTQNGEQIDSNVFGVTSSNPDWYMSPEVTFIATSSLTNLAFKDIGSSADSLGTFIDSVCLVPTKNPEPKTCSLDVVSDTTNVVVETGLNAVATWVHPGWTASIPGATWIWKSLNVENPTSDEIYTFTKYFNWTDTTKLVSANLDLATDNSYRVWVNDQGVGTSTDENNFSAADSYDVKSLLVNGTNKITVEVKNWALGGSTAETNPAGALYKLTLTGEDGSCTPDPLPQCSDGIDNDGDGFTDWPSDTTCGGPSDNDEQGGGGDEQRGTIIIKKEVTDGSDSDVNFFFNATWLGEEGTFSLTGGDEKSYVLAPGEYGVDEAQKLGWTLTNESCVSDNPTPTKEFSEIQTQITSDITLHDGEVVTCTFVNDQDKKNNGDDDGGGQSSGGGGRSHRNRSSSTGEVLGEQVLGDQVALAPVGAPNTGFGGLKMCFY